MNGRGTRWTADPDGSLHLHRRGVDHGRYRRRAPSPGGDAATLWSQSRPVHVPRFFAEAFGPWRAAIRRSRALFERLADGADPSQELWRRVDEDAGFEPAGATVDVGDPREIEKVHADECRGERVVAGDLFAKFSWIRPELDDPSLRIRFSFGDERSEDWRRDPKRARAADRYCEAVFPESRAIASHEDLAHALRRLCGRAARLSERIVFANAPGGGARFHHDAEVDQLGVMYAQLAGSTAWLALPKRELAETVRRVAMPRSAADSILERMGEDASRIDTILNSTPALTEALAAAGHLYVLRAGDLLLLPSHSAADCAWHSVFGVGVKPSLAHSYGIFAARK